MGIASGRWGRPATDYFGMSLRWAAENLPCWKQDFQPLRRELLLCGLHWNLPPPSTHTHTSRHPALLIYFTAFLLNSLKSYLDFNSLWPLRLAEFPAKGIQLYTCLDFSRKLFSQSWKRSLTKSKQAQRVLLISPQRQEGVLSAGSSSLQLFLSASPMTFWANRQRKLQNAITWLQGTWQMGIGCQALRSQSRGVCV